MDHLALAQIDAYVADVPPPLSEKEEIAGQQLGKIHGGGRHPPHLSLLGAGPGRSIFDFLKIYCTKPEQSVARPVCKEPPRR